MPHAEIWRSIGPVLVISHHLADRDNRLMLPGHHHKVTDLHDLEELP